MSGDNLHGEQPDIRYNVKVHHHEEWEAMSLSERMKVMSPAIELNTLNNTMEAKAKIHPSIELKETYLEKSIVTTNTINAVNEDGKNIITSGPIPVATPFPPLNLL